MLEEVLQSGKAAIRDFLNEVPDSTGRKMAENFSGFWGQIGRFAELGEDSANRSRRICETTIAVLHDTDLSQLEFGLGGMSEEHGMSGSKKTEPYAETSQVGLRQARASFEERQSHKMERGTMEEREKGGRSLCRHLPMIKEVELDDTVRERLLCLKRANTAADDLVKYVGLIASHLDYSEQFSQLHSQMSSCLHRLEQIVASVFKTLGNEIPNPERLARAAQQFDRHLPDVEMVVENRQKIIAKVGELQALAKEENAALQAFYTPSGECQDPKLMEKSEEAKGFRHHHEVIVGKVDEFTQKANGELAAVSEAYRMWKCVRETIREVNQVVMQANEVCRQSPAKMPTIVYETVPGNCYSRKVRDLAELQLALRNSVNEIMGWMTERITLMQEAQPRLECFEERHVNRTAAFPSYILLNETHYRSRNDTWIKIDMTVPHVHLFPFEHPMSIPDKDIAQILLLRLATTLPLGCCDMTILDHEAQGGSVLGITTMKHVSGLMNLVVRQDQVADALKGLYEYSGKLVADGYFTTEEPDWRTYNANHPEAPLPYKVLVVFSLAGIERVTDGMSMLQSLMKNGCSRGIHVVFAGDGHNQVCGDDPRFAADRKNRFSDVVIDVIQS